MAVYFQPARDPWYKGPLELLASSLIGGMMQRDSAARDYKYKARLAEDEVARRTEAAALQRQQALDDRQSLINYYNEDPNRAKGGGGILSLLPALGYTGNAEQVGKWVLPQMLTVDQGNQKTVAPVNSNGTVGEGQSYQMGMSPQDQGTLDLAIQQAAMNKWKMQQELKLKQRALGISAANAGRPSWHFMPGYTDTNGNPVQYDSRSGGTRSIAGVKAMAGDKTIPSLLDRAKVYYYLKKANSGGGAGAIDLLNGYGDNPPGNTQTAAGGNADAEFRALFPELAAFADAGGQAPAPGGSGGKLITTDQIEQESKNIGKPVEQVIKDAKAAGFTIIKSKH